MVVATQKQSLTARARGLVGLAPKTTSNGENLLQRLKRDYEKLLTEDFSKKENAQIVKQRIIHTINEIKNSDSQRGIRTVDEFFNISKRSKTQIRKEAIELVEALMTSPDTDISSASLALFTEYMKESPSKKKLCSNSTIENNTKANALDLLVDFVSGKKDRNQIGIELVRTCGYVYTGEGDDRESTWIRRGDLKSIGERDHRLFGFYDSLRRGDESERLLYRLAEESGLLENQDSIKQALLSGALQINSKDVRRSTAQQHLSDSSALKSETCIEAQSDSEREFLKNNFRKTDFQFTLKGFELMFLNPKDRKKAIGNFVAAFELLSYRKADLEAQGKKTKKVTKLQKQLLEKFHEEAGRVPEMVQLIKDELGKASGALFMGHIQGLYHSSSRFIEADSKKEAGDFAKCYGISETQINGNPAVNQDDLVKLQERKTQQLDQASITLANSILRTTGASELLDHSQVSTVEGFLATVTLSVPQKEQKADIDRWNSIIERRTTDQKPLKFFGLQAAKDDLINQMKSSTDTSVQYLVANSERFFGASIDDIINSVQDTEDLVGGIETKYITNQEKFLRLVNERFQHYKSNLEYQTRSFDNETTVFNDGYELQIKKIISEQHGTAEVKLIQSIINDDNQIDAHLFPDSPGMLYSFLTASRTNKSGSFDEVAAKRIIAIKELERRIIASNGNPETKAKAIFHIHRNILKNPNASVLTEAALTAYGQVLNTELGTEKRDYRSVIEGNKTGYASLVKTAYMIEELDTSITKLSSRVNDFARRETEILIKGLVGDNSQNAIQVAEDVNWASALKQVGELSKKIKLGDDKAIQEVRDTLRQSFGNIFDDMFEIGLTNDDVDFELRNHFVMSEDSNKNDLIDLFLEIWRVIISGISSVTK